MVLVFWSDFRCGYAPGLCNDDERSHAGSTEPGARQAHFAALAEGTCGGR
jgi:hypothetical protein